MLFEYDDSFEEEELIIEALEYTIAEIDNRIKTLEYYTSFVYKTEEEMALEIVALKILRQKQKKLMKAKNFKKLSKHIDIDKMVAMYKEVKGYD